MPLYFWGDEGNSAIFQLLRHLPGVWRHGDWLKVTPAGGCIIFGRSDATINRHGLRMGTSELYSAVEALPRYWTRWWSISNTWAAKATCRCSWCCARALRSTRR